MKSTKHCPFCSSTNVEEIKDHSNGLQAFAMRFYHDRRCNECEAIWTPSTPLWGAWASILTGVALAIGFGLFCFWVINDHWQQIAEDPWKTIQILADLEGFSSNAAIVLIPGLGCLFFGIRVLFSNREEKIQSQPLKSTPANPLPEYKQVLFVENFTKDHHGKPVGLHSLGVMVLDFRGQSSATEIIPYGEIDQLKIERETRGQRICSTFWLTLGLLAFGTVGSLIFYNMFFGSAPSLPSDIPFLGIIAIFGWAFLGPIALLLAPLGIVNGFMRLGVYLSFGTNRQRKRYYFEPNLWDEKRSKIVEILRAAQPHLTLPS